MIVPESERGVLLAGDDRLHHSADPSSTSNISMAHTTRASTTITSTPEHLTSSVAPCPSPSVGDDHVASDEPAGGGPPATNHRPLAAALARLLAICARARRGRALSRLEQQRELHATAADP